MGRCVCFLLGPGMVVAICKACAYLPRPCKPDPIHNVTYGHIGHGIGFAISKGRAAGLVGLDHADRAPVRSKNRAKVGRRLIG